MSDRERGAGRAGAAGAVFVALALAGCFGGAREVKPPGSALWLAGDSGELARADQSRLAAVGLSEVFLESGELQFGAPLSVRRLPLPKVPQRTPSTLVLRGVWAPGERGAGEIADELLRELLALRIEGEQSGLLVVGYHLEVRVGDQGEHLAKTLQALRKKLDGKGFLSFGFDRAGLAEESARAIAASCDFVTCLLYGQVPGAADEPAAWDLQEVEKSFRRLDALGRPYLTGAITLGSATHYRRGASGGQFTTEIGLGDLVARGELELRPGFSLQGIDRQLFEFVAQRPVTVGPFALEKGDFLRVVRTATPLMEEFRRRVGAWESPLRLGDLYYRLARPSERLSLSPENLVTVLGPASSAPELALALERTFVGGDRWIVVASIENQGAESSDLAFFDNNYVQVEASGAIAVDAEPGEFRRVDLLHDGERGTMQALRQANQARLYLPLLEGRKSARSGPLVFRLREGATPALSISASFLLPDGHLLATDPIEWNFDAP